MVILRFLLVDFNVSYKNDVNYKMGQMEIEFQGSLKMKFCNFSLSQKKFISNLFNFISITYELENVTCSL